MILLKKVLNNNFLFSETRELQGPITVEQILLLISNFYKEPLKQEILERLFDISELTNYHVFEDTCTPDFCGLELNEESGEYFVGIGPE
jgi:hypothetical protein